MHICRLCCDASRAITFRTAHAHTMWEFAARHFVFIFLFNSVCCLPARTHDTRCENFEWRMIDFAFSVTFFVSLTDFSSSSYPRTYKYIYYICVRFCVSNTFRKNSLLLQDKTRCQRDVILYQTQNIDLFYFILQCCNFK